MQKKFFTMFFLALIVSALGLTGFTSGVSTAPSISWSRTYGGSGLLEIDGLLQTGDGGFLLEGITSSGSSQPTYIELVKVDSSGNVQWNKTYEGISLGNSKLLIQTSDGNYALAGEFLLASQQKVGFWLAKINPDGDVIWSNTYFGEGFGWAETLLQTSDGGYAISGPTHADTHIIIGDMDVELIKTDSTGNQQWAKNVGTGHANSLIQTADEGYALVTYSTTADFLLTKTDSTGTVQWSKNYGGQDKNSGSSVIQTSDGGFVLGGSIWLRSNGGGFNLAIVKTDSSGNETWTKYYGAGFTRGLLQTNDGGFALVNNPLVKVDAEGKKQWELSFENSSIVYSAIQTSGGGYAVAGISGGADRPGEGWMALYGSATSQPSGSTPTPTVPELTPLTALSALVIAALTLAIAKKETRKYSASIRAFLSSRKFYY
jgi:hypothetical protein